MVLRGLARRAAGTVLLACALVCAAAMPGRAVEEAPGFAERRAEAGRLADEALALLGQQQCDAALAKFREADETMHSPVFVVFMARAEICLGQLVEAEAKLQQVVGEKLADYAPDTFWQAKRDAQQELSALAPRIPKWTLRIVGASLSDVTVKLDGKPVDALKLRSPVAVNPGKHAVEAETLDGRRGAEKFTADEGETSNIEIDVGDELSGDSPFDQGPDDGSGWWTSPYLPAGIAYGVGGAGLVMGIITGAIFVGKADELKDRCPNDRCAPEDEEEGDAVATLGTVATVGFIVAGVGAVAGTILLFTVPNDDDDDDSDGASGESAAVRIGPTGLLVQGSF